MKLIDWYIIRKYLGTFLVMVILFIPIGIMVDIAEKIDKFKENEVPTSALINYYIDFTWYFSNLLFPIFLFLSVIWFTSKLANNSEVIAIDIVELNPTHDINSITAKLASQIIDFAVTKY